MSPKHTCAVVGGCVALVALTVVFGSQSFAATGDECVGKPYGYPGCPQVSVSSTPSSSAPLHCGDGVVQESEGEQCDNGRQNGVIGSCDESCHLDYCGDGVVTPRMGEECEPQTEQVYVRDPKTGILTTQTQFISNQCGMYCTAPTRDAQGNWTGGCKQKFGSVCSSSSRSSASDATTLASSSQSGGPALPAALTNASSAGNAASRSDSSATSASSVRSAVCGDGIRESTEECDDGNTINDDLCTNHCTLPVCGDGIIQRGEQCDDGNTDNTDSCTNNCTVSQCGDGVVEPGEECDDGNRVNTDGCTNSCTLPRCGDGIVEIGEQCDDGNQNNNDLCLSNCKLPVCGDGVQEGLEQCDDGNRDNSDGCTNKCTLPRCGDGVVSNTEGCDEGLLNSDTKPNACRLDCERAHCGDHVVDAGEECDGGANCSPTCTLLAPVVPTVQTPPSDTGNKNVIVQGIAGAAIIVLTIVGYLFRNKLLVLVGLKKAVKDLDDIPLDQIEMPWNKW